MFKKKFLGVLLGVFALTIIPSVALAQTISTPTLEDAGSLFEKVSDGWNSYGDSTKDGFNYSFDLGELGGIVSAFAAIIPILSTILLVVVLPIGLITYIYTALAYSSIAKKLNVENAWFAWIPILSTILSFQIAGMSGWNILLMFIPIVNVVVIVLALMKTCERRGMNKLLGLLALIPGVFFILLGVLAWKKDTSGSTPVQSSTPIKEEIPVEPTTPAV